MEQWWSIPGVACLPKFYLEHSVTEEPRKIFNACQASPAQIKVRGHDSTMRKIEECDGNITKLYELTD